MEMTQQRRTNPSRENRLETYILEKKKKRKGLSIIYRFCILYFYITEDYIYLFEKKKLYYYSIYYWVIFVTVHIIYYAIIIIYAIFVMIILLSVRRT